MRTATIIAAAVAAGVVGTGAVVTPVVLAANDDPSPQGYDARRSGDGSDRGHGWMHEQIRRGDGTGTGFGMRQGMGPGMAEDRLGPMRGGSGECALLGDAASGKLTSEQKGRLADQAGLEKLSHAVYIAFGEQTGDVRFEQVAWSETRHLDAIRSLMDRYDVKDPTAGLPDGELPADLQDDYEAYVDAGSKSLQSALDTAGKIEQGDIDGLEKATEGLDAPDVEQVYEHLTRASEMHLRVFSR